MDDEKSKPKKPTAPEILSQVPRKNSYDKSHGSGNPHLQPGELQDSPVWKSHTSREPAKPKK
jgi:hypothetical protein